MNDLKEAQSNILNQQAGETRKGRVNNRSTVSVFIRGVAFKCLSGSRRELVLLNLKEADERGQGTAVLIITVTGIVAWSLGILTAWWII